MVDGTVNYWSDEGWGVLTSPEIPGEVWAHFSEIAEDDETGDRSLSDGDRVEFDWEFYAPGQDGYFYIARNIVRLGGSEGGWASASRGDQSQRAALARLRFHRPRPTMPA